MPCLKGKASGRKALAASGAAARQNLAAVLGRHAAAETVTPLADELGRLIGALHRNNPDNWKKRGLAKGAPAGKRGF